MNIEFLNNTYVWTVVAAVIASILITNYVGRNILQRFIFGIPGALIFYVIVTKIGFPFIQTGFYTFRWEVILFFVVLDLILWVYYEQKYGSILEKVQ